MDLNETRERIIYEKQGPIAKITLNWPEKANAQHQNRAVRGGTHMGLAPDSVLASGDASFSYPPLQGFGMPSGECSIEPWVFMNWRRAAYYLFTAEVIDAKKALEGGLVNG